MSPIFAVVFIVLAVVNGSQLSKISSFQKLQINKIINSCSKAILPIAVASYPFSKAQAAVQGTIKPSTLSETKDAIHVLESCIDSVKLMESAVLKDDYQAIGDQLSGNSY